MKAKDKQYFICSNDFLFDICLLYQINGPNQQQHLLIKTSHIISRYLSFILTHRTIPMFHRQSQFFQPLQPSNLINIPKSEINVCVLKHLQKPLQLLDKDDSYLGFADPVCSYTVKLNSLPDKLLPSQQNTQKQAHQPCRLTALQSMESQFMQLKRMYQQSRFKTQNNAVNNEEQQEDNQKPQYLKAKTLYSMFSLRNVYYCRFENHNMSKNNFANVFINIAGLNLQAKANAIKSSNGSRRFPRISNGEKRYNTGNLIFDSSFQSGNLLYVFEKPSQIDGHEPFEYQLILQNDTNTYGHNQWFFFRVQSLKPHHTVKFSVLNLIKSDSLFNYGLKPLVYSERQNTQKNLGWARRGDNVKYYQNDIRRQNKKENYFTLQFEYTFREAKDWVYFCPSYPYTYTQMTNCVQNLYQEPEYKRCFSIKTVCETLGKNKVSLISVSTGQKMIEECKVVWVLARQHPAETTGSYMVEGILRYLLPLITQAKTSSSLGQLHDYVFKIVPMVNVDGVIHGNSRAELIGLDPNRSWRRPRKTVNPVVYHLMKEIQSYKSNISLVLDLHSHSKKTGCFFYGNEYVSNNKLSKLYPTLICEKDQRFVLKNCRYRGGYKTTARHVLFKQLTNCENIFTVECSLLGYINSKTNRISEYTIQDYHEMGAKLIETFFRLENIKLEKGVNQLLEEFDERIDQVCEVDSAKSDSEVSEDEYEEVKELERRLVNNKKKIVSKQGTQRKNNRSLVSNLLKNDLLNDTKNKKRACSFNKHIQLKQNKPESNNTISLRQALNQSLNKAEIKKSKPKTSQKHEPTPIVNYNICSKQHSKNFTEGNDSSGQVNTISSLKQSYMKYLTSSKVYNQSKAKTEDVTCGQNKVMKEYGAQVGGERLGTEAEKRILQVSESNLNPLIGLDSKTRPLLVLGNTVQTDYTLFGRNEISIQVNSFQDDPIKKQQKLIAKLPKLMNMISASKDKMRKMALASYKENQNFSTGTPVARYNDTRTIMLEEKQKRVQCKMVVGNFRSNNL